MKAGRAADLLPPEAPPAAPDAAVAVLLSGDPLFYAAVRARRQSARRRLDDVEPEERTRCLYPSLHRARRTVPADLAPFFRSSGAPPLLSVSALRPRESASLVLAPSAEWAVVHSYETDGYRIVPVLAGERPAVEPESAPPVPGAPSWGPAAGDPGILFGLCDGSVALYRRGTYRVVPPGGGPPYTTPGPLGSVGAAAAAIPARRVRRIAALDERRVAVAVGGSESVHVVDLETGRWEPVFRNSHAWLVDMAGDERGRLWLEYTNTVAVREPGPGGALCVRAPWPRVAPPPDASPWVVHSPGGTRYWWWAARCCLCAGESEGRDAHTTLRDVVSVRYLLPVGEARLLAACQRNSFVWEPRRRRVASLVPLTPDAPPSWAAPGRESYLSVSHSSSYVLGLATGPASWRPFSPKTGAWYPEEPVAETAARPDLFETFGVPVSTYAYASRRGSVLALYRRPRYDSVAAGRGTSAVDVFWPQRGLRAGPYRVPFRVEGSVAVHRGVRFTPDERAIVIPSATGYSIFPLPYAPSDPNSSASAVSSSRSCSRSAELEGPGAEPAAPPAAAAGTGTDTGSRSGSGDVDAIGVPQEPARETLARQAPACAGFI
eukprot:tig00021612_g22854.t1